MNDLTQNLLDALYQKDDWEIDWSYTSACMRGVCNNKWQLHVMQTNEHFSLGIRHENVGVNPFTLEGFVGEPAIQRILQLHENLLRKLPIYHYTISA